MLLRFLNCLLTMISFACLLHCWVYLVVFVLVSLMLGGSGVSSIIPVRKLPHNSVPCVRSRPSPSPDEARSLKEQCFDPGDSVIKYLCCYTIHEDDTLMIYCMINQIENCDLCYI